MFVCIVVHNPKVPRLGKAMLKRAFTGVAQQKEMLLHSICTQFGPRFPIGVFTHALI